MKHPLAIAAILLSAAAAPGLASASDADCARIADVDVPFDVQTGADALRFEGRDGAVLVASDRIESNGQVFRDAAVRGYHDDLRGFLDNAGAMANVAKAFTRRAAFPQAATDMCRAILAVQASGAAMEQRFPGFASPVRVVLK
jgi:hypothetical protein